MPIGLSIVMYHGSYKKLPFDTVLNNAPIICNQKLECFIESFRPESKVSRFDCSYFCDSITDIDHCGGYTDFIYRVESKYYERSDLAWLSECDIALENNETTRAKLCAKNYWLGVKYPDSNQSVFEYRSRKVVIKDKVLP